MTRMRRTKTMNESEKPLVLIPLSSYQKMMAYVDLCVGEVTGFFDIDWDVDKEAFVVGEVYLIKQEAGAADVEMDEDSIAEFMEEMISNGAEQLPRGWWHSHVNMGAFFSGTDDNTINNDFLNDSFTISLVVNKQRQMKASLVVFNLRQPERPYLDNILPEFKRIDDLRVNIELGLANIPEDLKKEVEEKVQPHRTPAYQHQGNLQFSGKKNKPKKANTLPKDKLAALEKIDALDLERQWDPDFSEMVFIDQATDEIWRDTWEVVGWEDYYKLKGDEIKNENALGKLLQGKRCVNCNYLESHHNADVCPHEIYEPDSSGDNYDDGYSD